MSIFKRRPQQPQGQKRSPFLKIVLGVAAAVFVGAGAVAFAAGAAIGMAALIGLGALSGSVLFGLAGAAVGVIPGFLYAQAVEKKRGDGWHSTAAIMTGVAICTVLGMGFGAYRGYTGLSRLLMEGKGNAKTSFNTHALPQKAVPSKALALTSELLRQRTPQL